jgi:purine nucleosidase
MEASQPVWVDTDGGSDDALALLYLAAVGAPIVGVSTVGGVTDVAQAAANAAGVLGRAELRPPVYVGRARPSAGSSGPAGARPMTPTGVGARHGPDGLGGAGLGDPKLVADGDAVDRFLRTARRTARLRVLAIGPMTNLAAALEAEPDLPSRLGTVVCVAGGTVAARDTNTSIDPNAMQQVLDAFRDRGHLAVLTLTATLASPVAGELLLRLRTTEHADGLAWRAVAGYQARQSTDAGRELLIAHDALAAALLIDRTLATCMVRAGGRVEHGRAVEDGRGRIRWVTSLGGAAERVVDALAPGP